jgi:CheY-like chemotaxis protein
MANKTKILVVDDNPALLEMLKESLEENGYDVAFTYDGKEATKLFAEFKPDIVLTDIVMPGVDGIELLISLRNINSDIKIMAMSGGNKGHAETYLHMAEKLGANKIITKPFEISELLRRLDTLVD